MKWLKIWQISITFSLICFAWIFFRAGSLENGWYIASHLLAPPSLPSHSMSDFLQRNLLLGQPIWDFYLAIFLLSLMGILGWFLRITGKKDFPEHLAKMPTGLRWTAYYVLVVSIIIGGKFDNGNFIYFKF